MKRSTGAKKKSFLKDHGGTIVILICVFTLYEVATDVTGTLDSMFFPGFSRILPKMYESRTKLGESFISSMKLLIPGYFSALFCGIVLGIIIGTHPKVNKNLKPIIFALTPIPPSMLTPYLIAILPTFFLSSVAVIFIGCFWPVLSGTINGIILIEQGYLDNANVVEFKGVKKMLYVILPAAAPHILSGAATALNFSFILLVIAEMFATSSGMGYFVQYYADFSDYARVIGGLLFTAVVVVVIKYGFECIKHKILFWSLNEHVE